MKLQGFSIIFALVAIPLILVLTYYIQLQVDTITLQNDYDAKLLNSVRDAVSSFELNTANEDLSSVSDSLRTIIEASNNVFFNTLSTNLGLSNASKAYVEPYVPAVLYTLYDGYYISSPTRVPEVLVDADENAVSVGDLGVKKIRTSPDHMYSYHRYHEHLTQSDINNCKICNRADVDGVLTKDITNDTENRYYEQYAEDSMGNDYGQLLYVTNNPNQYTTDINNAKLTNKNVLKTYMPYSARYKKSKAKGDEVDYDVTVIYTLDNYITIEGTINDVYYTKSGYLIPTNVVSIEEGDKNLINNYSQEDAENYIKTATEPVGINIDGSIIITGDPENNVKQTYDELTNELTQFNNNLETVISKLSNPNETNKEQLNIDKRGWENQITDVQYELDKMSAVIYYVKAAIFSNWVQNNLNVITEGSIVEISGINYQTINGVEEITYKFDKESTTNIFDTTGNATSDIGVAEIPVDSPFYTHKTNVIRNSIQYNLNQAMSTYNQESSRAYYYEMPVMQNEEWDKILNNVSIVAFMQGYPCKLKTYNNYKVVSSTNNEITVSPKNIFYVPKDNFNDENSEYHRIDCNKLPSTYADRNPINEYMSFNSKEIKYDRISSSDNDIYLYDHKNLACYDCINDGNYLENSSDIFAEGGAKKTAYYIAVGKEKNNLYKMNAIDNSQGYEIVFDNSINHPITNTSSIEWSRIKAIEIVLGTIKSAGSSESLRLTYQLHGQELKTDSSISSNQANTTIYLKLQENSAYR